jgi:hypothetical protein
VPSGLVGSRVSSGCIDQLVFSVTLHCSFLLFISHFEFLLMPFIPLESHLPGITGLLEYRRDTADPIRALTQELMPTLHAH